MALQLSVTILHLYNSPIWRGSEYFMCDVCWTSWKWSSCVVRTRQSSNLL